MPTETLAIDFGTSNTAAAAPVGNGVRRIPIEQGAETLPTAVFFPAGGGAMRIGAAATVACAAGGRVRGAKTAVVRRVPSGFVPSAS